MTRALVSLVVLLPSLCFALAPATVRAMRNVKSSFNNVTLVPEFRAAKIDPSHRQSAENLLRDIDSALARAQGSFEGLPEGDRADPEIVALLNQKAELEAYRVDLKKNLEGGAAASAATDAQFRKFKEETQKYERAVKAFQQGPRGNTGDLKAAAAQLAELDALCKSKYPGIADDAKLSFQLAIEPGTWCATAAKRDTILNKTLSDNVAGSLASVVGEVEGARKRLASNQGFLAEGGRLEKLLTDRAAVKTDLTAQLKPAMDAAGTPMPADFFAPLDKAVDDYAAEIDRLASTWKFPAVSHDSALESGAKAHAYPTDGSVVQIGLLFESWSIAKNGLGVPTERYRTGALLAKAPGRKWCVFREWTKHEPYAGGGTYAGGNYTFGAKRLQQCP